MAVLWLPLLLLHLGMLNVACPLPVQESKLYLTKLFITLVYFWFDLQTRHQLEKLLDWENSHLYHKLGLHWKLARQRCDSTLMMEYVSSNVFHTCAFE